jgi:hypothetical protein
MKVNYPTNKKNTHKDFSDNFHNIENFVQVDHLKESLKAASFLLLITPEEPPVAGKIFQVAKMNSYRCQIIG